MPNNAWRVMVVEDSFDDLQVLETILEFNEIEVFSAANDVECETLLDSMDFDAVITDLAMPDADGWDILRLIRNNIRAAQIPVIAVTAYHSATLENEVYEAGFDGYFPKPLNPSEFIQQLAKILNG